MVFLLQNRWFQWYGFLVRLVATQAPFPKLEPIRLFSLKTWKNENRNSSRLVYKKVCECKFLQYFASPLLGLRYCLNGYNPNPFSYYSNTDQTDRKSTRLNSSHVKISYAVFCLKKK